MHSFAQMRSMGYALDMFIEHTLSMICVILLGAPASASPASPVSGSTSAASRSASAVRWVYVMAGVAVVMLLGQIAVFMPARRTSNVPPVVATRSV
jgi:ABC-type lipoprotein release transport system permease subunit